MVEDGGNGDMKRQRPPIGYVPGTTPSFARPQQASTRWSQKTHADQGGQNAAGAPGCAFAKDRTHNHSPKVAGVIGGGGVDFSRMSRVLHATKVFPRWQTLALLFGLAIRLRLSVLTYFVLISRLLPMTCIAVSGNGLGSHVWRMSCWQYNHCEDILSSFCFRFWKFSLRPCAPHGYSQSLIPWR